jgi:hypothetical protein
MTGDTRAGLWLRLAEGDLKRSSRQNWPDALNRLGCSARGALPVSVAIRIYS